MMQFTATGPSLREMAKLLSTEFDFKRKRSAIRKANTQALRPAANAMRAIARSMTKSRSNRKQSAKYRLKPNSERLARDIRTVHSKKWATITGVMPVKRFYGVFQDVGTTKRSTKSGQNRGSVTAMDWTERAYSQSKHKVAAKADNEYHLIFLEKYKIALNRTVKRRRNRLS